MRDWQRKRGAGEFKERTREVVFTCGLSGASTMLQGQASSSHSPFSPFLWGITVARNKIVDSQPPSHPFSWRHFSAFIDTARDRHISTAQNRRHISTAHNRRFTATQQPTLLKAFRCINTQCFRGGHENKAKERQSSFRMAQLTQTRSVFMQKL